MPAELNEGEQQTFDRLNDQICRIIAINKVVFGQNGVYYEAIRDEIVRSLVVFLHAQMEETIRGFALLNLHHWTKEKLNTLPLPCQGKQRAEKFFLGELIPYQNQSIQALFLAAADEWLNTTSFNDETDICSNLEAFGLEKPGRELLSKLQSMIKRRHRIVHHSDLDPADRSKPREPISQETIETWVVAVNDFLFHCHKAFLDANFVKAEG